MAADRGSDDRQEKMSGRMGIESNNINIRGDDPSSERHREGGARIDELLSESQPKTSN